jgi:phenylacetate-coenzyme A ligase PaaK-like adenylate-forming protein
VVTDRAVQLEDVRAQMLRPGEVSRDLGRYWVNATSGSIGQPAVVLYDEHAWRVILAAFARAHEWTGYKVGIGHRMRLASIASTSPWHLSSQIGSALKSWWSPALRLSANEPVTSMVEKLNAWQPEMLVVYASMARLLAAEQREGRLRIHPTIVFTGAEVLTNETRREVELAWGTRPYNQYATTETGNLAAERKDGRGAYLFEDLVICEVVDEAYRPIRPGEIGARTLVTVLFNYTQPLIRYELSDRLRLAADPAPDGVPFARIEAIEGRQEEVLRLRGEGGRDLSIQPVTFHRLMDALPVSGWQIVQEEDGLMILLSGVPESFDDGGFRKQVQRSLVAEGVVGAEVRVRHVAAIPRTASGKTALVKALPTPSRPGEAELTSTSAPPTP